MIGAAGNSAAFGVRRSRHAVGHHGRLGRGPDGPRVRADRRRADPGRRRPTPSTCAVAMILAREAQATGASRAGSAPVPPRRPRLPPGRATASWSASAAASVASTSPRPSSQAGGRGMVLVNIRPGAVTADFHAVPTVHLNVRDGHTFSRWVARHPRATVRLNRAAGLRGDTTYGCRGAPPATHADPASSRTPWPTPTPSSAPCPSPAVAAGDVFSGSSAAAAHASGLAALISVEARLVGVDGPLDDRHVRPPDPRLVGAGPGFGRTRRSRPRRHTSLSTSQPLPGVAPSAPVGWRGSTPARSSSPRASSARCAR